MKKILLLPICILFVSCYTHERNCADFKTGTFRFEYEVEGVKKSTEFTRTETLEIETFEGKTDTSTVRWINDCEYVLQKKHPKNNQEKIGIGMKILTTSKNSYTFEFGMIGSNKKQIGTVTKL